MAAARLLVETPELRAKHCPLPFAQAIVRSINKVAIKPLAGHAAAVVHGTGSPLKGVVVRDNDATFAGGHQLAGLKAECAGNAESPDSATTPLAGVGVG